MKIKSFNIHVRELDLSNEAALAHTLFLLTTQQSSNSNSQYSQQK